MPGKLEIDERRGFQERFWIVERAAWVCFAIIVLAALAGLTGGGGPLSRAEVRSGEGTIAYPRISRWATGDDLVLRFGPGAGEPRHVLFRREFLDVFEVETIQPAPVRSFVDGEGLHLSFDVTGAGAEAHLGVKSRRPGVVRYGIALDGGEPADLVTFILP